MPRFKTVGLTRCEYGHMDVFDIRIVADSENAARAQALEEATLKNCRFCTTPNPVVVAGAEPTEEISLHLEYTIYGYTCDCGERVEVERAEKERSITPPSSKTLACSKGHSRTIRNQEFPFLEHWEEKTN